MCRLVESLRRGGVVSWTRDFLREYRAEREADEQAKQEEDEQKEGANDEAEQHAHARFHAFQLLRLFVPTNNTGR